MVFNRFRLQVILRLALLCLSMFAAVFLLVNGGFFFTSLLILLFVCLQVWSLIRYLETTNRNLMRFLRGIRYADFTQSFSTRGMGRSFDELNLAFEIVMNEFRKLRAEREAQYRYLQTVIHHIGVGLMVYNEKGEIVLLNNAAKKIFGLSAPGNINELESVSPGLAEVFRQIRHGETALPAFNRKEEHMQVSVFATEFRIGEQDHKLVSIQNIFSELEAREIESWQKLIRVLTHEIMNSITPISTLTDTMTRLLFEDPARADSMKQMSTPDKEDLHAALKTISRRTAGLLNFVQAYRRFAFVPKPNPARFEVKTLFENLSGLLKENLRDKGIQFEMEVQPESLVLSADEEQIEQVLLNLLINAVQALEDQPSPRIKLSAGLDEQSHICLRVEDNGPGIPASQMDKIFIPFYTTKPEGSGIGLSISRQIMQMHKGSITLISEPGKGTIVKLRF